MDCDIAVDKMIRQSVTEFMAYMNNAMSSWDSMKKSSIETPKSSAEFVAMKHGMDDGTFNVCLTFICGNNILVLLNTTRQESTFKKNVTQCYHVAREEETIKQSLM